MLPYCPSLDPTSIDKSIDPCIDFYHYACGGWQKKNPVPPDQTSWSISTKLFQENLDFLHGILEQAASATRQRDNVTQEIGDFYAACMDEATVEKRGISAIQQDLDAIAQLSSTDVMATLVARLQLVYGDSIIFGSGSMQDPDNSEQVIAELDQGGLGLPDRDYYTKDDAKSKETREHYLRHIQKIFELMGDNPETAKQNADTVMRMETALAKASVTLVERNDPYKLKHKMKVAELSQLALAKLAGIRNKIGYPDKWRDYSSIKITRDDFAGNMARAAEFESHRQINKIGKPVDHGEWIVPPPTVDAYYDAQMNDINFPAGVLQPPLYDPKMDDAPNYGDTGGNIGHELTHGFDDYGSQYDAKGNLRNWWTKEDRDQFNARTKCIQDQFSQYLVVEDVHVNGELTLGENIADLGGEILAYMAWKGLTKDKKLEPIDGLTPEQRFFIGYAQWDCTNERPEDLRVRAMTDFHSPAQYRINGVVANMPEFAQAFSCKPGQPMVKPTAKVCRVW